VSSQETSSPENKPIPQERGATIHRRESRRQIWLPFGLGVALVALAFLIVAIPGDPIWRVRAQAIGDFLYTLLCSIPLLLCLVPLYVLVMVGIYGMNRLHNSTEKPLRRVENLAEGLANRIESVAASVNKQTMNFSTRIAPLLRLFDTFDEEGQRGTESKEEREA
jgi:hypothetical protein